ncbi:hypothetical protein [Erythrobacter sp.]|uniref:hypothetical protein n=1 Tax=Erythrobacter sp. TaxID=1042 RepID=UPI0025C6C51A|nr:hypothetical protein [Erythrobacter sp.]
MEAPRNYEARFTEVFQPIFLWGVGTLELSLVVYTLYMEFIRGTGPSLLSTVLPLSVMILIAWAVMSSLIAVVFLAIKNRLNRAEH